MTRVSDGFLLLAGREHAGGDTFRAHWWDGGDMLPANGGPTGTRKLLGTLSGAPGGRPEGTGLVAETDRHYEVVVLHDGVTGGAPTFARIPRR